MRAYASYPSRRCIECDSVRDCPCILVIDDGIGTLEVDLECPHKKERDEELKKLKDERAHS